MTNLPKRRPKPAISQHRHRNRLLRRLLGRCLTGPVGCDLWELVERYGRTLATIAPLGWRSAGFSANATDLSQLLARYNLDQIPDAFPSFHKWC
jgi:hypothetical protein